MGSDDSTCPHASGCEMYEIFTFSGTLNAWKINYCSSDYSRCERHKRSQAGQAVPVNLMPNGVLLKKKAVG